MRTRKELFHWIVQVVGSLADEIEQDHFFDDVDLEEQSALTACVLSLRDAKRAACAVLRKQSPHPRERVVDEQIVCTCGHPFSEHAANSPHACANPVACACRTFSAGEPLLCPR